MLLKLTYFRITLLRNVSLFRAESHWCWDKKCHSLVLILSTQWGEDKSYFCRALKFGGREERGALERRDGGIEMGGGFETVLERRDGGIEMGGGFETVLERRDGGIEMGDGFETVLERRGVVWETILEGRGGGFGDDSGTEIG